MYDELGSLAFSVSDLTSETVSSFEHFGTIPLTGDQPISRLLPTQDSTTQRDADIHLCLERDLNS
jgi:hypothetical protein